MRYEIFPFDEQKEALHYLSRKSDVTRLLYGGAASGGKSFLIQYWQVGRRLKYPGTRGFIGRNNLGDLRKFTIPEVIAMMGTMLGLVNGRDYKYNGQDMFIQFSNGSTLYFIDLFSYPSDPLFQSLGSTAYTDGAIEEGAEITEKATDIIYSRIRYRLTEFCNACGVEGLSKGIATKLDDNGHPVEWCCPKCESNNGGLLPKMLITCNPTTGHLRSNYYDSHVNKTLPPDRAFVRSLATNNPYTPAAYITLLESLPEMDRRRLLYGDWDYDNSSDAMFQYADLYAAFVDVDGSGDFYITADIARLGKDRTVICVWHGLVLIEISVIDKQRTDFVSSSIRDLIIKYGALIRNVVVDEDGIGGGVVDQLRCKGFLNNGVAFNSKLFTNQKNECYFKLAEMIEKNMIIFKAGHQNQIVKELQAVRRKSPDGDTKLRINSKDEQKLLLAGNSPDFGDAIMMRMFFEVRAKATWRVTSIQ